MLLVSCLLGKRTDPMVDRLTSQELENHVPEHNQIETGNWWGSP